jgi:hypothetical protein
MALTDKQRRFVDEYLVDLNATQAAIRAGYKPKWADSQAYQLLHKTPVTKYLEQRRKELAEATKITPEVVLKQWWELANVDVNDLVEYRRSNCRHCWGNDHEYQWTHGEFEKAQREAEDEGKPEPSMSGGFGFDHNREPNPECPECGGEGKGKIHVHDTRRLKGAARLLYAGVHQGKDGLKVLIDDRMKAREHVGRHLGMFNDKRDDVIKELAAEKMRLEIERMRIENERLRKEVEDDDDAPPESRKFVIEVKDARKRNDAES